MTKRKLIMPTWVRDNAWIIFLTHPPGSRPLCLCLPFAHNQLLFLYRQIYQVANLNLLFIKIFWSTISGGTPIWMLSSNHSTLRIIFMKRRSRDLRVIMMWTTFCMATKQDAKWRRKSYLQKHTKLAARLCKTFCTDLAWYIYLISQYSYHVIRSAAGEWSHVPVAEVWCSLF